MLGRSARRHGPMHTSFPVRWPPGLALEQTPGSAEDLESMMRAAHSIKGAARMVGVDAAVGVAHVMEDLFVAAQQGQLLLATEHVDELLKSVDLLGADGEPVS
ncbi:Hpt domain-containing protein [Candidatus Reidiella endopervernicosa]|uniref:Hpt domain-containing protein n=1 Tax=Candidatus Reidiella endopervernicosa TaxID=2738883 RepID=A0A6N0HVB7_9GAMM|nr:Hpt domain-containing protein [Candidatus Reidiella endopervernicosa]